MGAATRELALNGDMTARAEVHSADMDWQASPSGGVWRKRLHLVGGAESGQVTSVVRYAPGSSFPAHDHPEGEEILVLAGTFSDEHGDWPAGTYLLNPEGFRHAPYSGEGCELFVKLRQYPGPGRSHVAVDTEGAAWEPGDHPGVQSKTLYRERGFPESVRIERWEPGTGLPTTGREGGVEIFVLAGAFEDERGAYRKGAWLRLPPGEAHAPRSDAGCLLYVKSGGVRVLRSLVPA